MSSATTSSQGSSAEARTWAFSWQAAVGRDFFFHSCLAAKIRGRLISAHLGSGRVLVDFVLLPTEIHAVARVDSNDSVESVARAFGNITSRWVRQAHPVRSPVLAGPYLAVSIDSDGALRQEVRMLAWRPVLKRLCATPTHYPHGALRVALGLTAADGFDSRPMLGLFGSPVSAARAALRKDLAVSPTDQEWRVWELTRGLALATEGVGTEPTIAKSVDGAAAALIAAGGGYGIEGALNLLVAWVGAKIESGRPLDLSGSSSAQAARGRAIVGCLAVLHRLCSAASVARHFGRSKATLSEQMSACRSRHTDRQILATPLHRILEEAVALRSSDV